MSTVSPNPHPEPHEEQGRRDLRTEGQPSAAVRVEDLTVELPSRDRPYAAPLRALQGLDLTVPAGQVTALVGANGAGKTTALRTMIGAIAWSTGRLEVLGTEIGAARVAVPSGVAVVPDTPAYPERWTARRVARAQEATGDVDHRRFEDLLTAHRVPVDRPVGTLSRGQLTQLAVAAALARDPRLLILDEPFARLDPLARTDLVDELRALMALGDRTVLLSTHDLEGMDRFIDHLVVIADGRAVLEGDVETLCEEFLLLEEPQEASAERGAGSPLIGPVATGGTTRALVALDDAAGAAPGTSLRRPTMNELVTHCLRAAGPTER
jgi:ABC-2 type transport system ATP-binding protein